MSLLSRCRSDAKQASVFATAVPPDVQRWLRPAVSELQEFWAAPGAQLPISNDDFDGRA